MTERIEYRRLRAPSEDGGTLVDPPRSMVGELLEARGSSTQVLEGCGKSARQELLQAAFQYTRGYRDCEAPRADAPMLLAGHQPQLFHPGVWYKNFVLGSLAAEHAAVAINLVIDSDAMRSAAIRVPSGSAGDPHVESVAFDRVGGETPYEEHSIADWSQFESFGARARQLIAPLVPQPLVSDFWPRAIERGREVGNLGLALSQARHQMEGAWGLQTLELPQNRLCEFACFRKFAGRLLHEAPRMSEVYNGAAAEYRLANHIRSKAHPVPDLAHQDDWYETPFWVWTKENPRRRRLFVRQLAGELELTDRAEGVWRLGSQERVGDDLAELERRGIKVRTRALITTMFARMVLGDLFIHGLGGAKYDQVTDAIIRRFFETEAPPYLTVTATLRLPIARPNVGEEDLRRVDRQLRELQYHPERAIDHPTAEAAAAIAEKERWVSTIQTRENARERCHAIRGANEALQASLPTVRGRLLAERESLDAALRKNQLLGSREYAFCLYPAEQLRELFRTQ